MFTNCHDEVSFYNFPKQKLREPLSHKPDIEWIQVLGWNTVRNREIPNAWNSKQNQIIYLRITNIIEKRMILTP